MALVAQEVRAYHLLQPRSLYHTINPVIIPRSQKDGECDLVQLAASAHHEIGWAYLHDQSWWFAISLTTNIDSNRYFPVDLRDLGGRVSWYHTHPFRTIKSLTQETSVAITSLQSYRSLSPSLRRLALTAFRITTQASTAFPSQGDIRTAYLTQELVPDMQYDFRIVSRSGIVNMGIAKRNGLSLDNIVQHYQKTREAIDQNADYCFYDNPPSPQDISARLDSRIRRNAVRLTKANPLLSFSYRAL